ncbi:unnamed protein product [Lampetra fluviatilis]
MNGNYVQLRPPRRALLWESAWESGWEPGFYSSSSSRSASATASDAMSPMPYRSLKTPLLQRIPHDTSRVQWPGANCR